MIICTKVVRHPCASEWRFTFRGDAHRVQARRVGPAECRTGRTMRLTVYSKRLEFTSSLLVRTQVSFDGFTSASRNYLLDSDSDSPCKLPRIERRSLTSTWFEREAIIACRRSRNQPAVAVRAALQPTPYAEDVRNSIELRAVGRLKIPGKAGALYRRLYVMRLAVDRLRACSSDLQASTLFAPL
jgi:hypothetical protein